MQPEFASEFAQEAGLRLDKLLQQHGQHQARRDALEHSQLAYRAVIQDTRTVNKTKQPTAQAPLLEKALSSIRVASQLQKMYRLDKAASFHYVLPAYGLSPADLTQQMRGLTALKERLTSLAQLNCVFRSY